MGVGLMGFVEAVGLVLAIAALAGILWARFRTSSDETTALLWKGEADAQKARADRLELEFATYRQSTDLQIEALTRRIEFLEHEKRGQIREEILSAFSQLPCQIPRVEVKNFNG